jgi:hypothetical protein
MLDELTEPLRDIADYADPEDQALFLLVTRAVKRGDLMLARALSAVPPRSEGRSALMEANCPALARNTAICDAIETLAWRRAVVGASVRGDRRRARMLLDLAARRCAD